MSWLSSSFKNLFGLKKKEPVKVTSPYETAEGARYQQTIAERLAGRGVGYSPEVLSASTAPFAKARREGYQRYEAPQIASGASARGLGRSTVATNQLRLSGQEAERDIEQRIADIVMKNEAQKRAEINSALGATGEIATGKASVENQRALSNRATEDENTANRMAGFGKAAQIIGAGIGGAVGGPAGAMAGANIAGQIFSPSSGGGYSSGDFAMLEKILGQKAGTVNTGNIAGTPGSGGQQLAYLKAIGGL